MGVEEHGLFHLVSVDTIQEHALMASSGQDMMFTLASEVWPSQFTLSFLFD
jgi:hypothetical protein